MDRATVRFDRVIARLQTIREDTEKVKFPRVISTLKAVMDEGCFPTEAASKAFYAEQMDKVVAALDMRVARGGVGRLLEQGGKEQLHERIRLTMVELGFTTASASQLSTRSKVSDPRRVAVSSKRISRSAGDTKPDPR